MYPNDHLTFGSSPFHDLHSFVSFLGDGENEFTKAFPKNRVSQKPLSSSTPATKRSLISRRLDCSHVTYQNLSSKYFKNIGKAIMWNQVLKITQVKIEVTLELFNEKKCLSIGHVEDLGKTRKPMEMKYGYEL